MYFWIVMYFSIPSHLFLLTRLCHLLLKVLLRLLLVKPWVVRSFRKLLLRLSQSINPHDLAHSSVKYLFYFLTWTHYPKFFVFEIAKNLKIFHVTCSCLLHSFFRFGTVPESVWRIGCLVQTYESRIFLRLLLSADK